ncbi:MAG: ribonuclease R [Clostridia bacterium]|nr:ribonuclease R [Clostridia bacterium]
MTRKEKLLNFIKDNKFTPFSYNELALMLDVREEDLYELTRLLDELLSDKKVTLTKKKRYKYNEENDLYDGEFIGHDKGYGFIVSKDFEKDFFVSKENRKNALNKDVVKFKIIRQASDEKRAEAEIVSVLERKNQSVVGTFCKNKNFGFVIADDKKFDKDIFISKKNCSYAKDKDKVVCQIIDFGKEGRKPEGKIVEVIGDFFDKGNDVLSVIKKYDLPYIFPKKVIEDAKIINKEVGVDKIKERLDLRDKLIITIDGEDAKDLDDAISISKIEDNTYILGVHIADVSSYVKEGSEIDKEAYKRGTSVYLADRVVPMLPKELSNGICSLHPSVDRLAMSVFMTVDSKGNIINYDFKETVINSKYRMTYKEVTDILENGKKCDKKLYSLLSNMKSLAEILRRKRKMRGSLDFDFPECKIIYDENNFPVEITKYNLTIANYIIEEFMLLANETVAEYIYWQNKPMIYRIHEEPDPEKIDKFKVFIKNLGYTLKGGNDGIHPKTLLELLEKIKGDKSEKIIQTIMLRSLMKARYSPENKGHFGLSSKFYCHFTSPIRRYPDLLVHRILKKILNNELNENEIERYTSYIDKAAEHTSERERIAEQSERETEDIKKAIYMSERIGLEFEGIVSSVTGFGIFVELDNTVEGLVRYENIYDDFYIYDEKNHSVTGERKGKRYTIGDRVLIKVINSNPQLMEIDFELIKKI